MKIEIDLPKNKYREFEFLCKKTNKTIQEKILELILNSIDSSEIDNF